MITFQELAQQAQEALNRELSVIDEKHHSLKEQSSLLAKREADLDVRQGEIGRKEAEIQSRIEVLETREAKIKREDQVETELAQALYARREAEGMLKEAREKSDDATQKLAELEKRELALSEREKTYRQDVKNEVVNGLLRIN